MMMLTVEIGEVQVKFRQPEKLKPKLKQMTAAVSALCLCLCVGQQEMLSERGSNSTGGGFAPSARGEESVHETRNTSAPDWMRTRLN